MTASDSLDISARDEFGRSWRIAVTAMIGSCFAWNGLVNYSFGVLLIPMAQDFGVQPSAISGWSLCLNLGVTAAAPFTGVLADKLGARRVALVMVVLLAAVLGLVSAMPKHLWLLYGGGLAAGVVGSGAVAYSRTVIGWFRHGRGTALGLMSAGVGLSAMFGPRLMQGVIDAHGWRAGFAVIAGGTLLPLLLILPWLHERRAAREVDAAALDGRTLAEAWRLPVFWELAGARLLYGICAGGVLFSMVRFLTDRGLPRGQAAAYAGLLGLSMFGRVIVGYSIDRLPAAAVCAAMVAVEAVAYYAMGASSEVVLVFAVAVIGFAHGGEIACAPYLTARHFGVKAYGRIAGILDSSGGVGYALGPVVFTALRDRSGNYTASLAVAIAAAAGSALLFFLTRRQPAFDPAAAAMGGR